MNKNLVVVCIYNLCLLSGTAYLVQWHDWSPWWFVLTFIACANCHIKSN